MGRSEWIKASIVPLVIGILTVDILRGIREKRRG